MTSSKDPTAGGITGNSLCTSSRIFADGGNGVRQFQVTQTGERTLEIAVVAPLEGFSALEREISDCWPSVFRAWRQN